jgi:hypothetical protein
MSYSPILIAHIFAGTIGLLSGTAAMSFRKGSPSHVLAGRSLSHPCSPWPFSLCTLQS